MAAVASKTVTVEEGIPQWKKDLIARLKNQNKKTEERLWTDHHTPHHHIHHKGHLVCPSSSDSEYCKESESPGSSDSEDLHYGPGIVNRLRNKYLSLALRESNPRPTILRKATSLENLLDDDGGRHPEKDDGFIRRTSANEGGNRYRSASRRQEMKRARSVEVISRANHEDDLVMSVSVTTKINNRQSLHEDMLKHTNEEKAVESDKPKTYKVPSKETNGNGEDISDKFSRRINRPKRISPLLNEREKPPVDVVKHAKMIFEKKPETRTKKPHHTGKVAAEVKSFNDMIVKTKLAAKLPWKPIKIAKPPTYGDVAAKVDSFNDIIVKNHVASTPTKPTIKTSKPVLTDKSRSNTHHHVRPVAKPIILSEEIMKPKTLELSSPKQEKKDFNNLPSPIPDVSIVDRRSQDGIDFRNNSKNSLCETPDLILTSSPIQKIHSPTYRKQTTENFITEERNRSYGSHPEATNKFVSPIHSPIKVPHFNRLTSETLGFISPITQKNTITKNSATYNFLNADVDQRHLPLVDKNSVNSKESVQENSQTNAGNKIKLGLTALNNEKNLKNLAKSEKKEREIKPFLESEVETKKHIRTEPESTDIVSSQVSKSKNEELVKSQNSPSWIKPEFKLNKVSSLTNADPTRSTDTKSKTQDYKVPDLVETDTIINSSSNIKNNKPKDEAKTFDKVDQSVVKPVQSGSVNGSGSAVNNTSVEDSRPIKIVIPKKTKPKKEEATSAVFNFTTRTDVPDYISNDTSRVPSRPVIPKPDEPGIKLLPDALLSNYKEFQDMWEEDELIKSLEARPPSPCNVTFINDNILIDGKSSFIQRSTKRVKLNISFVDDAEIYEYPSEISLLIEESQFSTIGGSAQVGHNTPTLSGSSLATYTPKTTEDFQLGVMKTFQDIPTPCTKASVQEPSENINDDVVLEEVEKPVLFSSGSTSILF